METATIAYEESKGFRRPTITFDRPVSLEDFREGLFAVAMNTSDFQSVTFDTGITSILKISSPVLKGESLWGKSTFGRATVLLKTNDVNLSAKLKIVYPEDEEIAEIAGRFDYFIKHVRFDTPFEAYDRQTTNTLMETFATNLVSKLDYTLREEAQVAA